MEIKQLKIVNRKENLIFASRKSEINFLNKLYIFPKNNKIPEFDNSSYEFTDDLSQKVYTIFKNSLNALCTAEIKFKKEVSSLFHGNKIKISYFVSDKTIFLKNEPDNLLKNCSQTQKTYLEVLNQINSILKNFQIILSNFKTQETMRASDEKIELQLIESFSNKTLLSDENYLNKIIGYFFSLQIKLLDLHNISVFGASYLTSEFKQSRAKKGGDSKNYGENILISLIVKDLKENRPKTKKFKTINNLLDNKFKLLTRTLEKYQSETIGTKDTATNKTINYGKKLLPENLIEKIKVWYKENIELSNEIIGHHLVRNRLGYSLAMK